MNKPMASDGGVLGAIFMGCLGLFLVMALLGAAFFIATYGQEIYSWVSHKPVLGFLTGLISLLPLPLTIDPSGISSDSRLFNDGTLGLMTLALALIPVIFCISMLGRVSNLLSRGLVAFIERRRRSLKT